MNNKSENALPNFLSGRFSENPRTARVLGSSCEQIKKYYGEEVDEPKYSTVSRTV